MKNFDWTRYTKRIALKAPIYQVYAAWTTAEELERWFLKQVEFYKDDTLTTKQAPAEKGDTYNWKWHLYEDTMSGKIVEANGKDLLQFTFEGESVVEVKLTTAGVYHN